MFENKKVFQPSASNRKRFQERWCSHIRAEIPPSGVDEWDSSHSHLGGPGGRSQRIGVVNMDNRLRQVWVGKTIGLVRQMTNA